MLPLSHTPVLRNTPIQNLFNAVHDYKITYIFGSQDNQVDTVIRLQAGYEV